MKIECTVHGKHVRVVVAVGKRTLPEDASNTSLLFRLSPSQMLSESPMPPKLSEPHNFSLFLFVYLFLYFRGQWFFRPFSA